MKTLEMHTHEEYWGNDEYDDVLQGIYFEIPDEIKEKAVEFGIDADTLFDFFLQSCLDSVKILNAQYVPFYNQTTSRYDIQVMFDYSGSFTLGGLDSRLSEYTITFSDYVSRAENKFTYPMLEYVTDRIELMHKEALKSVKDVEWIPEIEIVVREYNLRDLTKTWFRTVADIIRDTYEYEQLEGEKLDEADNLLEKLEEFEKGLYDTIIRMTN